jgi:hypothetical protein
MLSPNLLFFATMTSTRLDGPPCAAMTGCTGTRPDRDL